MPTGKPITAEIAENVIKYYKSKPMTIRKCASDCGLSSPTIIKILDSYSIKRYKKAKVYSPNLREDYFDEIDTEDKAYFLGLIIADGNVHLDNSKSNRQASISITQSETDQYILELFLRELSSTTTIGHDGRGTCQVAIRSNLIASALKKYGVIPNKTLCAYLPKNIDKKYMAHLIRGIMDGDGNITSTFTSAGKHKHAISFCGTHELMNNISSYLHKTIGVTESTVYDYRNRHLSEVKWQSIEDVLAIGNWLYDNATIYLFRKKEIFQNFKSHYGLK